MNSVPPSFREHHLLQVLELYEKAPVTLPIDRLLRTYFRTHRAIGSKDRRFIAQALYDMVRFRGSLDALNSPPHSWKKRLTTYTQTPWQEALKNRDFPPHIRLSFPKELYSLLIHSLGKERGEEFCRLSNQQAPTTVRINPLKTTREEMLKRWSSLYDVAATERAPWGIVFAKRENFFGFAEFKEGLFEMQDEGSQLLAELIDAKPKEHVLDYCAGSGGKTLAFAHKLQGQGQIYLHDIRASVLQEAKKRLKRAGIQNAQTVLGEALKQKRLKSAMDWVLVDAPCSGTGTLRRNPDMKWKWSQEDFERVLAKQRAIFEEALSFLSPTGKIVYATCSVLPQENERQVEHFTKAFALKIERVHHIPLEPGGPDGFFGAVLSR